MSVLRHLTLKSSWVLLLIYSPYQSSVGLKHKKNAAQSQDDRCKFSVFIQNAVKLLIL